MSRRKPVLNLGPRSINRNTPDKDIPKNGNRACVGLGLLGSYGEDSDDGVPIKDDYSDDEEKLPKSTIDSKVADFLKEIGDLDDTVTVPLSTTKKTKKQSRHSKKVEPKAEEMPPTNFEIQWGSWQQCIDEHTQHPYYWNIETNEVTWIVPEEIAKQYDSQVSSAQTNQEDKEADLQRTEDTPPNASSEENAEVSRATYPWEEQSDDDVKSDIDVDAELDSALETSDMLPRYSRKKELSDKINDDIPAKRRKLPTEQPSTETDAPLPAKHKSKAVHEDEELLSKTELWQQWEEEFTEKEDGLKVQDKLHGLDEARSAYESDDKDESEDEDLSKYDMMALEEASNTSENKSPLHEQEDTAVATVDNEIQEPPKHSPPEVDVKPKKNIKGKLAIEKDLSTLINKMNYLKATRENIPVLFVLFIEAEVRMKDWKAGELSDDYVKKKLEDCASQLTQYEKSLMPLGWTCHWDRRFNRYYYTDKGGITQWDFPEQTAGFDEATIAAATAESLNTPSQDILTAVDKASDVCKEEKPIFPKATEPSKDDITSSKKSKEKVRTPKSSNTSSPAPPSLEEESTKPEKEAAASSDTDKTTVGVSGSAPYPGVSAGLMDYSSYNMQSYYWNMQNYGMQYGNHYDQSSSAPGYDENYRNSPMHDQPPPPPGEDVAPLPPSAAEPPPPPPLPPGESEDVVQPPPPPPPAEDDVNVNDDGIEMEISDVEEEEESKNIEEPLAQTDATCSPRDYSPLPPPSPPPPPPSNVYLSGPPVLSSAPVLHTSRPVKPTPVQRKNVPTTLPEKAAKTKKIKKDKVPTKKPPKQMFGMVAKWQKAKQEIEEEEKRLIRESEMELDQELDVNHRIEKWKKEQLTSGQAVFNANFTPVSDDWKKRIKQRKSKIT